MSYHVLQLFLFITSAVSLVLTQFCSVSSPSFNCGCKAPTAPYNTTSDWAGYVMAQATNQDANYFYIDDMAFRKSLIASDGVGSQKPADQIPLEFWPGGVIHYKIDTGFGSEYRGVILEAINIVQGSVGKAHLEFVEVRTYSGKVCRTNYLNIEKSTKNRQCVSEIGMQTKSPTLMSLTEDACSLASIVHELLHALGRFHEQSRPDRDKFVSINYQEMPNDSCQNFDVMPKNWINIDKTLQEPYDIDSIMHYGSCYFSCRGKYTMLKKDGTIIAANREKLSELDKKKLKLVFPTDSKQVPSNEDLCPPLVSKGAAKQRHLSIVGIVTWSLVVTGSLLAHIFI